MHIYKILKILFIILIIVTASEMVYYFIIYNNFSKEVKLSNNEPSNKSTGDIPSNSKGCPSGFIRVPGNPQFVPKDFCVMKYEAKCDKNGDGLGETSGPNASYGDGVFYDVWDNKVEPCGSESYKIVSAPQGWPIGKIAQKDKTDFNAESLCSSRGWHLITNNEWMTVARNIEKQWKNWCFDNSGKKCNYLPGTHILTNGHSDYNLQTIFQASFDDQEACFGTVEKNKNTGCGEQGTEKRTHVLSNGEIIWDFAGNMWEYVSDTINIKTGKGWGEFTDKELPNVIKELGPSDPSWNTLQGVGGIYHNDATDSAVMAVVRGGGSDGRSESGIFTLVFDHTQDDTKFVNVGFRCVAEYSGQ